MFVAMSVHYWLSDDMIWPPSKHQPFIKCLNIRQVAEACRYIALAVDRELKVIEHYRGHPVDIDAATSTREVHKANGGDLMVSFFAEDILHIEHYTEMSLAGSNNGSLDKVTSLHGGQKTSTHDYDYHHVHSNQYI